MDDKEIGIFETKTHLSEIIERVSRGETFYVTKRGTRVAELRPVAPKSRALTRGCAKNSDYWMDPNFDQTPTDFDEYT